MIVVFLSSLVSAQTTPHLGLNIPSPGTVNWNLLLNSNFSALDLYLSGGLNLPGNLGVVGNLNVGGTVTCGSGCGGTTFSGDLSGTSSSQTVVGLQGKALPSLSTGCLNYTGSAWNITSCGAISGSGTATQVAVWSGSTALTSYSGFTSDSSGNVTGLSLSTNGSGPGRIHMTAGNFAALTALVTCNSGNEGYESPVTDSTTATWGATISGSSSHHVLAYCDGTNWTVAAE